MNKHTLLFFLFTLLVLAGCTKKGPSPNLCPTVCDGLVAYFPFYGDATDKSGNGHDGKVIGAELTKDRNGYPNHAYEFDGSSNIGISTPTLNNNDSFTIHLILKIDRFKETYDSVSNNNRYNSQNIIISRSNRIKLEIFNFENSNTAIGFYTPAAPNKGHALWGEYSPRGYASITLAFDFKKKNKFFFLDGVLINSEVIDSFYETDISKWYMGGSWKSRRMFGVLDELRIYNRALSADEVKELYLFTSAFPPVE